MGKKERGAAETHTTGRQGSKAARQPSLSLVPVQPSESGYHRGAAAAAGIGSGADRRILQMDECCWRCGSRVWSVSRRFKIMGMQGFTVLCATAG